jgi:hypothetical protein
MKRHPIGWRFYFGMALEIGLEPIAVELSGGIIAGGAGAVVGAISAKERSSSTTVVDTHTEGVIIYLSDIDEPIFKYEFDNDEDNKKIYATLLSIISMYN